MVVLTSSKLSEVLTAVSASCQLAITQRQPVNLGLTEAYIVSLEHEHKKISQIL